MQLNPTAIRTAGVFAFITAITTAILTYGPDAARPSEFDEIQQLHSNALYLYKRWILFIHPQISFLAALAAGALLFRKSPACVAVGVIYTFIWAFTEMTQQAYIIDALNNIWRPAYLEATGADKTQWKTMINGLRGISDSLYFVLIVGYSVGAIMLGAAFRYESAFGKNLGRVMAAVGVITALSFLAYYTPATFFLPLIDFWYEWLYGPVQVSARAAFGYWLWLQASQLPKEA